MRTSRQTTVSCQPGRRHSGRYDKIHMFDADVGDGKQYHGQKFQAGAKLVHCQTDIGHIGLSVCYDIRFPDYVIAKRGQERK